MRNSGIKTGIAFAAVVIVSTTMLILIPGCGKKETGEIKIGAVLPLTGNSALWGQPTKEGIDLATDMVNASGGIDGKRLTVIYEDSQGDPSTGVAAIRKLIQIHKVPAIIDNSNSSVTLAMAPIAESNQVVLMVTGASSPDIADAGEFVFRIWNSDALEGALMADYAFDSLKAETAGILYVNNSYGQGLYDVFTREFAERGGRVIVTQSIDESTVDFRSAVSMVLQANPEILYLVAYPNQGAPLVVQLKELGCTIPIIGAVALEDPNFFEQAGNAANGLMYPIPAKIDTTSPVFNDFKDGFYEKYAKPISFLAAEGYDGLMIIARVQSGMAVITGDNIRQRLNTMPRFDGASGIIEFDIKGEVNKPFGIREVVEGQPVWRIRSLY